MARRDRRVRVSDNFRDKRDLNTLSLHVEMYECLAECGVTFAKPRRLSGLGQKRRR